jgi:HlyD family secretion protein
MTRLFYVRALMIVTVGAAGCAPDQPANALRVSGHVEATEVQVASEVGGRILELRVAEGDRVTHGDVIASLDVRDSELQIQRGLADPAAAVAQ